jgi:hypothetical protein
VCEKEPKNGRSGRISRFDQSALYLLTFSARADRVVYCACVLARKRCASLKNESSAAGFPHPQLDTSLSDCSEEEIAMRAKQ